MTIEDMKAELETLREQVQQKTAEATQTLQEAQAVVAAASKAVIGLRAQKDLIEGILTGVTVRLSKEVQDPTPSAAEVAGVRVAGQSERAA